MKLPMEHPGVGVALYVRRGGKVLLGKRKSTHGKGEWCAPGGKLEMNESPEDCARRETAEETGLMIDAVRFIGITNDIWPDIGTHFVTVSFVADWQGGEASLTEPDKFETWGWFEWEKLPSPLFLSTRNFIKNGYNPYSI
jgi:8-oxo-dGTP diphosphatase